MHVCKRRERTEGAMRPTHMKASRLEIQALKPGGITCRAPGTAAPAAESALRGHDMQVSCHPIVPYPPVPYPPGWLDRHRPDGRTLQIKYEAHLCVASLRRNTRWKVKSQAPGMKRKLRRRHERNLRRCTARQASESSGTAARVRGRETGPEETKLFKVVGSHGVDGGAGFSHLFRCLRQPMT